MIKSMLGHATVFYYSTLLSLFPQKLTQNEKYELTSQELVFHMYSY